MPAVDHIFICTAVGAPEGDRLVEFGLTEGAPNRHPGQGTANRRFFFRNFFLELLWVEDPAETQSEPARALHLWERWSGRHDNASPFGVILRPAASPHGPCPFPSWRYAPPAMPGLVLEVATGAGLQDPLWCYANAGRPPSEWPAVRRQPMEHAAGFSQLTAVRLTTPCSRDTSVTSAMAQRGIISLVNGPQHLLELEFDVRRKGGRADFRPALPVVFVW